jgi:hypothetical protein
MAWEGVDGALSVAMGSGVLELPEGWKGVRGAVSAP